MTASSAVLLRLAAESGFPEAVLHGTFEPRHLADFDAWLARGDDATMGHLGQHRDLRADARRLHEGASAVLCVAVAIPTQALVIPPGLRIASFARVADYHDSLRKRLRLLGKRLAAEFPGLRFRACVDSAPLLERDLAWAGGLGLVGKSCALIHPRLGSFVLLAELLLAGVDFDLPPASPRHESCGRCARCLESCPGAALRAPRSLDARRCVAYLTIEHPGSLPLELRPSLGDWIFGCDVCQQVCPWNRFRRELSELPALPALQGLDARTLLSLDEVAFRARFRQSSLLRAGRERLARNVCVALGNLGERSLRSLLEPARVDPSPIVREHAEWAWARLASGG